MASGGLKEILSRKWNLKTNLFGILRDKNISAPVYYPFVAQYFKCVRRYPTYPHPPKKPKISLHFGMKLLFVGEAGMRGIIIWTPI